MIAEEVDKFVSFSSSDRFWASSRSPFNTRLQISFDIPNIKNESILDSCHDFFEAFDDNVPLVSESENVGFESLRNEILRLPTLRNCESSYNFDVISDLGGSI